VDIFALMKMLTVRIPEELHRALKVKCASEGLDMQSVLTKLIEGYVKARKAKAK
jgi:predicted DNA binding CopG/RHH family protein